MESDKAQFGCIWNYNNSFVRDIVNNWSSDFADDLVSVRGYKARLIESYELDNMGHKFEWYTGSDLREKSEFDCLYSDADYWSMHIKSNDGNYVGIEVISKIEANNRAQYSSNFNVVRPVINLKKCIIDGSC